MFLITVLAIISKNRDRLRLACTLDSLLVIRLDHLRTIFRFRLQLRQGRHHTYNPSLTNAPT